MREFERPNFQLDRETLTTSGPLVQAATLNPDSEIEDSCSSSSFVLENPDV